MKTWRQRRLTPSDVIDGAVTCPVTNERVDIESCLDCGRLGGVERAATGDAPLVVRCRLEASWRDVPAAFIS